MFRHVASPKGFLSGANEAIAPVGTPFRAPCLRQAASHRSLRKTMHAERDSRSGARGQTGTIEPGRHVPGDIRYTRTNIIKVPIKTFNLHVDCRGAVTITMCTVAVTVRRRGTGFGLRHGIFE